MKWFANLKTGLKLGLGFGLTVLLTVLVGGIAISRMQQMNTTASLLKSDTIDGLKGVVSITSNVKQFRIFQFRHVLESDDAEMTKLEQQMQTTRGIVEKDIADYEKTVTQETDRANTQELKKCWSAYLETFEAHSPTGTKKRFQGRERAIERRSIHAIYGGHQCSG